MPIKNYTTSVDEHKSVSEIQALLGRKGARQIQIQYSVDGKPEAIAYSQKQLMAPAEEEVAP